MAESGLRHRADTSAIRVSARVRGSKSHPLRTSFCSPRDFTIYKLSC